MVSYSRKNNNNSDTPFKESGSCIGGDGHPLKLPSTESKQRAYGFSPHSIYYI